MCWVPVPMLVEEEDEGLVDLLVINDTGRSILELCGGCVLR